MSVAAFALIAFAVYVWLLWIRKTFNLLFLLPAIFITRYGLAPAMEVLAYGRDTPQVGGRLAGGFIVLGVLLALLTRPRRSLVVIVCILILIGVLFDVVGPEPPILVDLVKLLVIATLAFIAWARPDLLSPRGERPIRDVFD